MNRVKIVYHHVKNIINRNLKIPGENAIIVFYFTLEIEVFWVCR